jgi:hypothetical protein
VKTSNLTTWYVFALAGHGKKRNYDGINNYDIWEMSMEDRRIAYRSMKGINIQNKLF